MLGNDIEAGLYLEAFDLAEEISERPLKGNSRVVTTKGMAPDTRIQSTNDYVRITYHLPQTESGLMEATFRTDKHPSHPDRLLPRSAWLYRSVIPYYQLDLDLTGDPKRVIYLLTEPGDWTKIVLPSGKFDRSQRFGFFNDRDYALAEFVLLQMHVSVHKQSRVKNKL